MQWNTGTIHTACLAKFPSLQKLTWFCWFPFWVGSLIPCLTAIITEDSLSPALWVLIALTFVQSIDNYFVEPNVVGGEVRLTALSTILSIFAGGFLWGIAGMVLFIPLLSMVKIICDRVEALKPFGYLIGDDDKSPSTKLMDWVKKIFR